MSNTCFELLLASFIQLECSPTASTAAAAESWANERVLEKIGGDCAAASVFSPLSEANFSGFDVGVRMAERCSRDFPKRMGTELQVTTHKFGLQSQPQAQRSPPPLPALHCFRSFHGFATLFGRKCSASRYRSCAPTAATCTR